MRESAAHQQDDDVPDDTSVYEPPDPRKQLSVRVKTSIHTKVAAIVRLWQANAKGEGKKPDEINAAYVVERLLADKCDTELSKWGGMPPNEKAWALVLKEVEANAKK